VDALRELRIAGQPALKMCVVRGPLETRHTGTAKGLK
jgi:hypothetical protein